jgi:MFS family permease
MVTLSLALPLLQQASGVNTVIYYSSMVFLRAGMRSPVAGSVLVGAVNLAFTVAAAPLLDRRGRRPLLRASFLGMAAALAAVALVDGGLPGEIDGGEGCCCMRGRVLFA